MTFCSDITFEPIPSDYAILKIVELPATGGDTLWARWVLVLVGEKGILLIYFLV